MRLHSLVPAVLLSLLPAPFLIGCASTRYQVMNALGEDPKPQLKESMSSLRDSLSASSASAVSAHDRLRLIADNKGVIDSAILGSYTDACKKLDSALKDVRGDSRNTEDNALATFNNWRKGLNDISDAGLRAKSQANLERARTAHTDLMAALVDSQSGLASLAGSYADLGVFIEHNSVTQSTAEIQRKLPALSTQTDGCKKLVDACQRKLNELSQALDS